jgi:hypothetical protein
VGISLKTLHLSTSKSDQYIDLFAENTFSASPKYLILLTATYARGSILKQAEFASLVGPNCSHPHALAWEVSTYFKITE